MDLTDEAKEEIKAAIKILREDGVHIHRSYAAFLKSQEGKPEEKPKDKPEDKPEEPTEGAPPPVKDEPTEKPKKKGLWWGDAE